MTDDLLGSVVAIVAVVFILFVAISLLRAVRIVPQSEAFVVERLGRFRSVMHRGVHLLVPFVDRVAARIDLREQVVNFPSQSVITADQAMVEIDSVIYFQITDPRSATYEVANFLQAIEQLTATTLRNLIGSLDLEETQTSRESINKQLRGVLDEATGPWGIRVTRVELKSIEPPPNVLSAMVQQITAERTKRATILTAEAEREAQIKKAEGAKQAAVLAASAVRRKLSSSRLKVLARHRSCARRVKQKPSLSCSRPLTRDMPRRNCSPTSTWRCCPELQMVKPRNCGCCPQISPVPLMRFRRASVVPKEDR